MLVNSRPRTAESDDALSTRLLWVLVTTASWALLCELVLGLSMRMSGPAPVIPGPVLLDAGFIWIFVLTLVGVTGRVRVAAVSSFAVVAGLAAINWARMDILMVPLLPSDLVYLRSPGFLVEMVGPGPMVLAVVALAAVVIALALLARRVGGRPVIRRGSPGWRGWFTFRLVTVVVGISLMWTAASFNSPDNAVRGAWEAAGARWLPWSQADNYRVNGFIGGFLYNTTTEPMPMPDGYGQQRMTELAQKWSSVAERSNQSVSGTGLDDMNVVIVLSESMGDPLALSHVQFEEDPIPRTRDLMRAGGGHLLASYYGTGTSSMEFSALTGQSPALFSPQITSPYQQFVADRDEYPSLVGWMKSLGHRTVAIHPYSTEMYRRPSVYETLGFDDFIDHKAMQSTESAAKDAFISDRAAYAEVVHQLQSSAEPALVHLVTMQNHLPYAGVYPDPIETSGVSGTRGEAIGQWARGLQVTDEGIDDFLEAVQGTGEPTVVIHFGDHFPGIFDPSEVEAEGVALRKTPYFVWSSEDRDRAGATSASPVAASSLMEIALDKINASAPPYLQLLRAFQEQVGVLMGDRVVTPAGVEMELEELSADQRTLLEEVRLVQYDFSTGEGWAKESMWYPSD